MIVFRLSLLVIEKMRTVTRPFWILLALIFLFEAWLWERLRPLVAWIVDRISWAALRARIAAAIQGLPPYPTLLVFLVPAAVLMPLKFLGLWLLARGSWLGAIGTLVFAKVVGLGVTSFIFDVTRPALLQLPWFRWLYAHVLDWLARAHALIDPIKNEVRARLRRELRPVRRRLRRIFWLTRPGRPSRFFERVGRIRRRMRAALPAASGPAT
ncbi:MAG: hypothetical protein R3D52_10030 [Xanthobacteraceae bacterium]